MHEDAFTSEQKRNQKWLSQVNDFGVGLDHSFIISLPGDIVNLRVIHSSAEFVDTLRLSSLV